MCVFLNVSAFWHLFEKYRYFDSNSIHFLVVDKKICCLWLKNSMCCRFLWLKNLISCCLKKYFLWKGIVCNLPPLELELHDLPKSGAANPASRFRPRALYITFVPSVLIQPDRPTDRDAAATGRPAPARALPEELMNVTKLHIGLAVFAIIYSDEDRRFMYRIG